VTKRLALERDRALNLLNTNRISIGEAQLQKVFFLSLFCADFRMRLFTSVSSSYQKLEPKNSIIRDFMKTGGKTIF
jgi:hypothetical protein